MSHARNALTVVVLSVLHVDACARGDDPPAASRTVAGARVRDADLGRQLDVVEKAVLALPPETKARGACLSFLGDVRIAIGETESARRAYDKAAAFAASEEPGFPRSFEAARLAIKQFGIGDVAAARASIRLAVSDAEKVEEARKPQLLERIVAAQAKVGDPDGLDRSLDLLRELARREKLDDARPISPANAAISLIRSLTRSGRYDEAFELVRKPPFGSDVADLPKPKLGGALERYTDAGLRAIADCVDGADREVDRRVLMKVAHETDLHVVVFRSAYLAVARSQIRIGDVSAAAETIRAHNLTPALPELAKALFHAGDRAAALKVLAWGFEEVKDHGDARAKKQLAADLFLAQLAVGDFAGAIRTAECLGPGLTADRIVFLVTAAHAQRASGDSTGAKATEAIARADAERRRAQPVAEIIPKGMAFVDDAGKRVAAENESAREDYGRTQLCRIAAVLGDFDEARGLAAQVRSSAWRRTALESEPLALADAGDVRGAVDAALRQATSTDRTRTLFRITAVLANRVGVAEGPPVFP
jgi:tetratricopeptide (TPR) repeat protein